MTEEGEVLQTIQEPPNTADEPVATEPAPEDLEFWGGDIAPTLYRSVGGMDLAGDAAADAVATGRRDSRPAQV